MKTKAFAPKPLDPGTRITWTDDRDHSPRSRRGTVWSKGRDAGTSWVVPDFPNADEAPAILVRTRKGESWTDRSTQALSTDAYQKALAEAYRSTWSQPSYGSSTPPRDIHLFAERLAKTILRKGVAA